MDAELPPDFKEFLRLLKRHGVDYLLIGGLAVAYHGYARSTQDMDVWVAKSPDNAKRIVAVLKKFGFDTPELSVDLFLTDRCLVRMGYPPVRIEILTKISGATFPHCFANRVETELDGVPVKLISLKDLKRNKRASGRHKDLDDLEHLP